MVDISVLMPCHNEENSIRGNIIETVNTLKNAGHGSFEVIVIDDGSLDRTFEEIQAGIQNIECVKSLQLKPNNGKGYALKKGFEQAEGKYICFLDGDLDIHPRIIKSFMELMKKENSDVVIGSKRHPSSIINSPLSRRILSFGYQCFVKMLFDIPVRDSQVGIKLFKREVLEDVFPRVLGKKYAFDIELLVNAHRNNYKIVEAPIKLNLNTEGSDINIQTFSRMFIDTCAIFYRTNILHYYDTETENAEEKYQRFVNVMQVPVSILFKR